MDKKALVLLSGGLDSGTALYYAKSIGFNEIYAISFQYGQKHTKELNMAKKLANDFGVKEHKIVNLDMSLWGGSSLTDNSLDIPDYEDNNKIPNTYVPARNMVFLSIAASYAESREIYDIFIGVSEVDYSGYVDCRQTFITAMENAINQGTVCAVSHNNPIKIHAPFINMKKSDEIKLGISLGIDYSNTWSCYKGTEKPCGRCDSCVLRKKAFKEAGFSDPLLDK